MGNATFTDHGADRGGRRCYATPGHAMLLIADPGAAPDAERAIAEAGGRLLQRIAWREAAALLPQVATSPVVLIDTTAVAIPTLDAVLPAIRRFLVQADAAAVVLLTPDRIDIVAGYLIDGQADLLCEPTSAQVTAALASAAARNRPPTLHDSVSERVQTEREPFRHPGHDSDEERLRRLIEGMAQISRYAADLTRGGTVSGSHDLADRRRAFHGEPAASGHGVTAPEVRRLIHLRQLRGKFFGQFIGEGLFEDPAWDMLLDLFAAELEGIRVSVSSLCIAAAVAPTTALRWITRMTEMGLFIRHPDPVDRRRAFMALSPRASEAMRAYMLAARKTEAG
ncbi:MarR family winged helix-turn-helix transcriptional regulator [Sphingomonas sp. RP10(2022)]|uniref:MarR family winged helix-turn-helix transcriptional regulator n=1 Tax=Sphingomonas liriopis TaxID=2949094 RepID=A0A9X2HZK2_9SPHN|nr:MarR family winged helix-turn-helix transcriptional regulator [Sphingomonas liriopis]MCP3735015.1 MarR family winged helix-turn-helix transcriptional regulator [Sphingomonas liriopis]